MQERQVSIGGETHPLSPLFLVLATQNPIEHEGTYRLPEAQLDRFLFKVGVNYPSLREEVQILQNTHEGKTTHFNEVVQKVLSAYEIEMYRKQISSLYIEEK